MQGLKTATQWVVPTHLRWASNVKTSESRKGGMMQNTGNCSNEVLTSLLCPHPKAVFDQEALLQSSLSLYPMHQKGWLNIVTYI